MRKSEDWRIYEILNVTVARSVKSGSATVSKSDSWELFPWVSNMSEAVNFHELFSVQFEEVHAVGNSRGVKNSHLTWDYS